MKFSGKRKKAGKQMQEGCLGMTECMISCTNPSYQSEGSFGIIIANKVDSYKKTANKDHNTANTG